MWLTRRVFAAAATAAACRGVQTAGTIEGTAYGGSGSILPNPQVRVTNEATRAAIDIVAGYGGKFVVKDLAPGRYTVSVVSFESFPTITVEVRAGETSTVDLRISDLEVSPAFAKPRPITMAELQTKKPEGVAAFEVTDYVYGNYRGDFPSPPHADGNPRRAFIVIWKDLPYRLVFAHEGSYCPWFELPSGAAVCYQFFEGNQGWAELFNDWGRKQRNSYVEILENHPRRVWLRWTYFGVNMKNGDAAYRGTEDFWAYPNGLVLRRQSYETLRAGDARGHAREPIEMIGMCPVGKRWVDVLARDGATGESHALAALDPFSRKRYDVFWKPVPGKVWESMPRRTGASWKELDDSAGVALVVPMQEGAPFCVFGDASGFRHDFTRIKEHSHKDTGGIGWVSQSWDHWPIGWLNSQAHVVDRESLARYPNHFSPAGMDFFALPNEQAERGNYYSLIGVGGADLERVRTLARNWLAAPKSVERLPAVYAPPRATVQLTDPH